MEHEFRVVDTVRIAGTTWPVLDQIVTFASDPKHWFVQRRLCRGTARSVERYSSHKKALEALARGHR
jgi:hypothetical protein